MDFCVRSSRKSASRLICLIASSAITTRAPHSVTIVVVCCGVLSNRALNVKVSLMCSFFSPYLRCYICLAHFNAFLCHCILLLSMACPFFTLLTRLWHECTQLLSEESGQSLWNQPETTGRGSFPSLPGLHSNKLCFGLCV